MKYKLYNNFNIENKKPIHELKKYKGYSWCLTMLNDGRLASGAYDSLIIIYDKDTFKSDFIIEDHKGPICNILQLNSGLLASCSLDKTIKLFDIKGNKYELIQTLNSHKSGVLKIIECKNEKLVSCLYSNCNIIIYNKDNLGYREDCQISTTENIYSIIQTNINELCCSEGYKINFYDLKEKKIKASLSNINICDEYYRAWMIIINDYLLIIPWKK